MNKNKALDLLLGYLSLMSYHLDLPAELISIIGAAGFETKFFTLLTARLHQLSVRGIQATVMKEFEPLVDGLYSMHLSGKDFNVRILYGFLPNGEPVLLHAFHEKAGKKITDYTKHIPIASVRLAEFRKEFEYES